MADEAKKRGTGSALREITAEHCNAVFGQGLKALEKQEADARAKSTEWDSIPIASPRFTQKPEKWRN